MTDEVHRLSPRVVSLLEDRNNYLLLSSISVAEIGIKYRKGLLTLPSPPAIFIPQKISYHIIHILPFDVRDALRMSELPLIHRDPFDRMMIAQALVYELPVITKDSIFSNYSLTTIW
jgi:PIN domain nuclease of toxin-antitoxin system